VDECGATEHFVGCKVQPLSTLAGKLSPVELERAITRDRGSVHRVQPRVISLAQATERGTLYRVEELRANTTLAHEHGLLVHMDGARIANAAAALETSFRELTTGVGVDLLSFGGTKNGLMMAEALVVLNPALSRDYPWIRKQGMQLGSKQRFLAAQYLAYFDGELWRRNALNANAMATYLAQQLSAFDAVAVCEPVEVNLVFARIPSAWVEPLHQVTPFLCVPRAGEHEARFVTSFDTTRADIDDFIQHVQRLDPRRRPR
jgi:threonine aldolase